jgi:invasion protein IalB
MCDPKFRLALLFTANALALTLIASALSVGGVAPAVAQQSTTATYQDWVLQCAEKAGPPLEKVCAIEQITQVQGKNVPFSRVAIERPEKGHPVKLVVQVPINILIAASVRLQQDNNDPGTTVPFDRCLPVGCFADFDIKDDVLKKFSASDGLGKITFKDATAHDVTIPLSFKGFRQAFEALNKG